MAFHRQDSWAPVAGEWVQIRSGGRTVDEGRVDFVTADEELLWLCAHGATTRRIVAKAEGYEVWKDCNCPPPEN